MALFVVPLVGTWIETRSKHCHERSCSVVPLVGTWIETDDAEKYAVRDVVVPLVGTWIETITKTTQKTKLHSRSPRGNVD